jgi:hypothetical protein
MDLGLHEKGSEFLYSLNKQTNFFIIFIWKSTISGFKKLCPVNIMISYADSRADVTKLVIGFRSFGYEPNKYSISKNCWADKRSEFKDSAP